MKDLGEIDEITAGLYSIGFHYRKDNPDLSKRYFRETTGMRRTHIHVRQSGSWSEQFNLLFRDFLREHENERNEYARVKYELARQTNGVRRLDGVLLNLISKYICSC